MKLQNDNRFIHLVRKHSKEILTFAFMLCISGAAFAQSDIIPSEIKTTFEALRDWIKDEIAPVLLGMFWIGTGIYYGYHKDSNRAKAAFIAVTISAFAIGVGLKVVERFLKMGN